MIAKILVMKLITSATSFLGGGTPAAAPNSQAITVADSFANMDYSNRYGGVTTPPPGFATGGIARGSDAGYSATLHGTEAVVPLPNNKSIPVDLKGSGQTNNVSVNINIDKDGNAKQDTQADGAQSANMGAAIAKAVQKELQKQKRSGGILSPYGAA